MEELLGNVGNMKSPDIEKGFKNKTVLVTGHTGFIGTWMCVWLQMLGSKVIGFSQKPLTKPSMFQLMKLKNDITHIHGDVSDFNHLKRIIKTHKPEFIFHLAAQSIVRESFDNPLKTFQTNVLGTANILESIRNSSVKSCIIMTSDKCYDNKELGKPFTENHALGGNDPYSASKGAAELVTNSYRSSFFKKTKIGVASVRAGNVIGGGDWSRDRLVPDCFRSLEKNKIILIRNPYAIRPWQFVLEPIRGMFYLALLLKKNPTSYSEPWNLGPDSNKNFNVEDITKKIILGWGKGKYKIHSKSLDKKYHESKTLLLNSSKANKLLNWKTVYSNDESFLETIDWYKQYYNKGNMKDISIKQIKKYMKIVGKK